MLVSLIMIANEKYKPQVPDIMESIFDAGYLIFDLIAGMLFFAFSKGNPYFCNHHFIWLLHPCNIVQQIKAEGWLAYDSQNLCIYVDYRNGTSALILSDLKQYQSRKESKIQ